MQTNGMISCISQNTYRIIKKGADGGQGSIWFVEACDGKKTPYILKIINEKNNELKNRKIKNIMSLRFFSSLFFSLIIFRT